MLASFSTASQSREPLTTATYDQLLFWAVMILLGIGLVMGRLE